MIQHLKKDYKLVKRDMFLWFMFVFIIYIGMTLRYLTPWINERFMEQGILPNKTTSHEFSHYYVLIISHFVIFTGGQIGSFISSLLILGERESGTFKALLISPLNPQKYLDYRLILSTLMGFSFILFMFYTINILVLDFLTMLLISLASSLISPMFMLFLLVISKTKVQLFSYGKFISLGGLVVIVSWWMSEPIQYLFGLFPPYWMSKAYWTAVKGDGLWLLYLGIGIIYHLGVILYLRSLFLRKI